MVEKKHGLAAPDHIMMQYFRQGQRELLMMCYRDRHDGAIRQAGQHDAEYTLLAMGLVEERDGRIILSADGLEMWRDYLRARNEVHNLRDIEYAKRQGVDEDDSDYAIERKRRRRKNHTRDVYRGRAGDKRQAGAAD